MAPLVGDVLVKVKLQFLIFSKALQTWKWPRGSMKARKGWMMELVSTIVVEYFLARQHANLSSVLGFLTRHTASCPWERSQSTFRYPSSWSVKFQSARPFKAEGVSSLWHSWPRWKVWHLSLPSEHFVGEKLTSYYQSSLSPNLSSLYLPETTLPWTFTIRVLSIIGPSTRWGHPSPSFCECT